LNLRKDYELRTLKNRVLMKIFGSKRDEVTGENCLVRSWSSSPSIIILVKSRRVRV
jgi:hypothetical protein